MLALAALSKQVITAHAGESASILEASDEALVGAIAGGDRRAMQALYLRHKVRIYRFVLRLVGDAALAEEPATTKCPRQLRLVLQWLQLAPRL